MVTRSWGRYADTRNIFAMMTHALVDALVGFEEVITDGIGVLRVGLRSRSISVHISKNLTK